MTYKLCKKYGKVGSGAEPIVNVYLTEAEFEVLSALPGTIVSKRRYRTEGGVVDIFVGPHQGLAIFEAEFDNELAAQRYQPPSFAVQEITGDERFSGAVLSLEGGSDAED